MEQAFYLTEIENIEQVGAQYQRIYFGNEFCQRRIPALSDVERAINFIINRKLKFSFVTPYATDSGIDDLMPIFEYLSESLPGTEIVINDWGVFAMLKEKFSFANFSLGRLLTKQGKDPRIAGLGDKASRDMRERFQDLYVDSCPVSGFLADNSITRVELDNPLQGIVRDNPVLKASLYFPFIVITTTRYCPVAQLQSKSRFLRNIPHCDKGCREHSFLLARNKDMPVDLILKGNTQFYKNESLPANLEELNIDRLVYEPLIPI